MFKMLPSRLTVVHGAHAVFLRLGLVLPIVRSLLKRSNNDCISHFKILNAIKTIKMLKKFCIFNARFFLFVGRINY
jgi:hypothetical protein